MMGHIRKTFSYINSSLKKSKYKKWRVYIKEKKKGYFTYSPELSQPQRSYFTYGPEFSHTQRSHFSCNPEFRQFPRSYFTYSPELSQPLPREPKWVTADEAVKCIKSGNTVFFSGAVATPQLVPQAMTDYGKSAGLKDVTVCHMFTLGEIPYIEDDCKGIFRALSFFVAPNIRKAVSDGKADCLPVFLYEIPKLFSTGAVKIDVAVVQVSPPDAHGFCSLGTNVEFTRSACAHSKFIIAEVNKYMPRTFGDAQIHSSHIDFAIQADLELLPTIMPMDIPSPDSPESKIGQLIAENLIEDGSTIQTGFGKLPEAILHGLKNHKDLGVHTEMFSDGVMELVKLGVITNNKKPLGRGFITSSFFHGSSDLYKFADNNPLIEMRVVDYTNNVFIISQLPKMTAVNACIEIDLTGQVVSDSIGTLIFSGFGGQLDFVRGAIDGKDGKGKAIIATLSVNPGSGDSKIVPILRPGAGVVVTRGHIRYVVTEYGIASLFGKNLRQRAHALINIAHPNHREALEKAAFERLKVMPSP